MSEIDPFEVRAPRVDSPWHPTEWVRLVRWLVPDGARVGVADLVCETENKDAFIDVEVVAAGVLRHLVDAGAVVKPDQLIARIIPDP